MNHETLHRLLVDRKLGELPADVCELLDAYLDQHPEREAVIQVVDAMLDLARQALHEPCAQPAMNLPPPLSVAPASLRGNDRGARSAIVLPSPLRTSAHPRVRRGPAPTMGRQSALAWARRLAVAAVVVVAFLTGARVSHAPNQVDKAAIATSLTSSVHQQAAGFWSLPMLREKYAHRSTPTIERMRWADPLTPLPKGGHI